MRSFVTCAACQRPHRADERACPFCQALTPKSPFGSDLVRTVKVGGLLAFTAVATAACYGAPMPPGSTPPVRPSASASAGAMEEKVPTATGTATRFVTPKGGKQAGEKIKLAKALLADSQLVLAPASAAPTNLFSLKVTAESMAAFEATGGVYKAIDLETAKDVEIAWGTPGATDPAKGGTATKATNKIKGTLQLANVTATAISGTLLAEVDGTTVAIYFNAAR